MPCAQVTDSRGDSRLSMSVTLTSDHSKIFFAAVTAAFAAPPPGRTATAAPHWPLQCRCTAARSRRTATAAQRHCRRRLVGDSPSRVSVWHAVCRRGSTAAALRLPQPASAGEPARLRRCTAAALPPQSPHRVRTDSAVPPLPRHPRVPPRRTAACAGGAAALRRTGVVTRPACRVIVDSVESCVDSVGTVERLTEPDSALFSHFSHV